MFLVPESVPDLTVVALNYNRVNPADLQPIGMDPHRLAARLVAGNSNFGLASGQADLTMPGGSITPILPRSLVSVAPTSSTLSMPMATAIASK